MNSRTTRPRIICTRKVWEMAKNRKAKVRSIGEEVIDTVSLEGMERIPHWQGGYSTEHAVIIGKHRIPRAGLQAVFYDQQWIIMQKSLWDNLMGIDIDCFYENGDWISFTIIGDIREEREEEFRKAIRRFDESIPFYHHMYWEEATIVHGLPIPPAKKYVSCLPSFDVKAIEELSQIGEQNPFWEAGCKVRKKWNGEYELELLIRGKRNTNLFFGLWLLILIVGFPALTVFLMIKAIAPFLCVLIFFIAIGGSTVFYNRVFNWPALRLMEKAAKSLC